MAKKKAMTGEVIRKYRTERGLNQQDFWAKLHLTQSAGSRYETGRDIPGPTEILLRAVIFGESIPSFKEKA